MSSTRFALYVSFILSVLSLFILCYVLIYNHNFISHNIIFNSFIAIFDFVVIGYAVYTVFYLSRGMTQWSFLKDNIPSQITEEPVLRGGMSLLRGRLSELTSIDESERTAAVSLLSKALEWRVVFLMYASGVAISIGLLGTFFGLTITMDGIREAVDALSSSDQVDSKLLVSSLATPLGGMATAFSSSMFGLASSICTGLIAHFLGRATDGWVYDVEKWSFVVSEKNALNEVKGSKTDDPASHAIYRLVAIFSRHIAAARENGVQVVDAIKEFTKVQSNQQDLLKANVKASEERFKVVNDGVVAALKAFSTNNDVLSHILNVSNNSNQSIVNLVNYSKANNDSIENVLEAVDRNTETVIQNASQVNQFRVECVNNLNALLGTQENIEKNINKLEQETSILVSNSNDDKATFEKVLQLLKTQQGTMNESLREMAEARISIVSTFKASQKKG